MIFVVVLFKMLEEKLNKIEVSFAIKDMENLSGVRAETIRIWESRYGLLKPKRSKTNIRSYDLEELKKLLNISLLIQNGFKISKVSKLEDTEIDQLVLGLKPNVENHEVEINALSMATLNFDYAGFNQILDDLIEKLTFEVAFVQVMVPFMNKVGVLWQVKTIMAANEHFASNIIKQRLFTFIEQARKVKQNKRNLLFVLFLPMNEIHELGLLFLQYKILSMGFDCLYLGQSVPISNLRVFERREEQIIYFMSSTVSPKKAAVSGYLNTFGEIVRLKKGDSIWVTGRNCLSLEIGDLPMNCRKFNDFESAFKALNDLPVSIVEEA